jgi:hypothetical protein
MDSPERPTDDQILAWLRLSAPERRPPARARTFSASLPRLARVLWLRYCAAPPLSVRAVAKEYGLGQPPVTLLAQRGLALLAWVEEQGTFPAPWDPDSPLGRAVILHRLRPRRFVPRAG